MGNIFSPFPILHGVVELKFHFKFKYTTPYRHQCIFPPFPIAYFLMAEAFPNHIFPLLEKVPSMVLMLSISICCETNTGRKSIEPFAKQGIDYEQNWNGTRRRGRREGKWYERKSHLLGLAANCTWLGGKLSQGGGGADWGKACHMQTWL